MRRVAARHHENPTAAMPAKYAPRQGVRVVLRYDDRNCPEPRRQRPRGCLSTLRGRDVNGVHMLLQPAIAEHAGEQLRT